MSWFILLALLAAPQSDVQLQTLDGNTLSGTLRALDGSHVVLNRGDADRNIPLPDVLQIHFPASAAPAAEHAPLVVTLVEGSRLQAARFSVRGDQAEISLDQQHSLKLPVVAIATVRAADASAREEEQWQQAAQLKAASDMLVVRKKDSLDYLEGVLHDVDADQVKFEVDGETVPVKWSKTFGLIYYHSKENKLPEPVCRVLDRRGNVLAAKQVTQRDGTLDVELPAGGQIELPITEIRRLDYSLGKIVYLSDLDWDPKQSERTALFGGPAAIDSENDLFAPQRDRALDGGELLLDKKSYSKGLAIHSRTRLVYRLPGGLRRFTALAGIDDRMENRGNVQLTIEADGNRLLEKTLAGGDPPLSIDLPIEGAKRLAILVDFGAQQDVSDHLDLCEAKLIK